MGDVTLFLPETVALLGALALFAAQALGGGYGTTRGLGVAVALATVAAAVWSLPHAGEPFAPGIYRVDLFSQVVKVVLAAALTAVVALADRPHTLRDDARVEVPLFLTLATVGMMMLASATELITLYISMELAAYPVYVVVALHRDGRLGGESATKYMLQGMAASAVTLYGFSFIYGLTGSTYGADILARLVVQPEGLATQPLFWLAVVLVLAGFLFKLAAFPFHFWAPDTYQAAPHEVVTFVATASKVAAIAVLIRIVAVVAVTGAEPLGTVLMWASVAAMTLGNLAALRQGDLKRLLGYSAVAHAGYVLIGLQAASPAGLTAALFYAAGYAAMSLAAFVVVCEVGRDADLVTVADLSGLHRRSPGLALTLLVGLLGLIGLPPTVGFLGKWFLFSAAIEQGQFGFVLVASINAVVATYYYLLVLRQAYFADPVSDAPLAPGVGAWCVAAGAAGVTLAMGVVPGWFWGAAMDAVGALAGS